MKSSLNLFKKRADKKGNSLATFLLVFVIFSSILITPVNKANAQMDMAVTAATVAQSIADAAKWTWEKVGEGAAYVWKKAGSIAFQQTIRTAVSKIAYDTATWLGSGDKGQKPLFITQDWGAYLAQVGDEAAGEFIETFTSNLASSLNTDAIATECQKAYIECSKTCPSAEICRMEGKTDCDKKTNTCKDACKTTATECNKNGGTGNTASTSSSTFLTVGNNTGNAVPSINVCQPSSLEASLQISLGLVNQTRPGAPNCTASTMVQNWGDEVQRLTDFEDPYFTNKITGIFNPVSNDLGIAMSVRSDMLNKQVTVNENNKLLLAANKGWKDKVNIAKELIGVPGEAEAKRDSAGNLQDATFGQVTGDILVDAASIFLNQIALTSFNNLMANLGKKTNEANNDQNLTNPNADPSVAYGEKNIKEAASFIIKPNFGVQADYDILADLSSCPDKSNPGPTNCVIDSQFMQGITDKRTVAEAVKENYIKGNWSLTQDTIENAYSLRSVSILRKYRVLPIGWEEAINRAYASSTAVKKFTVGDLVSCFDQNDTYNQYSQDFNVRDQAWCRGLVDPNWVLKAPLNYCSKSGVGAQLVSKNSLEGVYSVSRAEEYCADEKTCIKEKSDGSCEVYGYCNEEKRTWNFSSDSCEAIDNTCNSFTNTSSGRQVSYLENTLNYGECNVDTAGCRQYSTSGAYATTTGTVTWNSNKSIYFNKNISTCNSKDEGCTELIRIKPTWGTNLVMDSSYSNDQINASSTNSTKLNDLPLFYSSNSYQNSRIATIVDSSIEPGDGSSKVLKLEANGSQSASNPVVAGLYSSLESSLLPANFELMKGESYTFSADVYLVSGRGSIYLGEDKKSVSQTINTGSWQHLSLTRTASDSFNKPYFGVLISSIFGGTSNVQAYVRNLKFEVSNFETQYDIYGAYRFYEKIIPPYLESVCYQGANSGDYSLRSGAPAICNNFARKCNSSEVGCELFTSQKTKLNVSAQVASSDYCPKECVGYDMYISKASYFHEAQAENIIPSTATTCSAEAVGCSEFTNLDEVAQGGEKKEYYSALKHCIKPSQSLCSSFYSWEGTSNGYQLRLYSLQKDTTKESSGEPMEFGPVDPNVCNAEIYNKPTGDPKYNPDCREFYNAAGKVSYHLMSRTITCSDNCHSYRLSGENLSGTCLNGGKWDSTLKACVYEAIPGEGKTCNASENACREYNGADGNNTQIISSYDFETGAQGWNSNCVGGLQLSTISNNKDGHSIFYKNSVNGACAAVGTEELDSVSQKRLINQVFASDNIAAQLKVGNSVSKDKSYTIRFIAKSDSGDANLQVYFYNNKASSPAKAYFAAGNLIVRGGGEWNIYQANLSSLDHEVSADETLVITSDRAFYFDEIVLTEITNRFYLIKDTSVIPDICFYDMADNFQGADHNLGCSVYSDRAGNTHNLRKFSKLCSSSSVGCEQMIDTENYSPYGGNIWGDVDKNGNCDSTETDCIKVSGDNIIYAVYDQTKKCNPADKSCSRLGQGVAAGTDWSDVYKKNNPDLYDKNLCGQAELNCEEWSLSDGSKSYFKDPGNEVCQYRSSRDSSTSGKAWYKIPVKRCDVNSSGAIEGAETTSKVCSGNSECSGKNCVVDNNDYPCSTSNLKTLGLGGVNNAVLQPDKQVGLCNANASGCTEYIDPVSKFSPNLVNNPGFESTGSVIESWDGAKQTISLEKNKLYIFSVSGTGASETSLTFDNDVRALLINNNLGAAVRSLSIGSANSKGIIFSSGENVKAVITGGEKNKLIEIKESIVSYQLKENIDTKSCNGSLSFDNGCVLFNERSISGSNGLSSLAGKWDAASSANQKNPVNCDKNITGSCTANQLVKVRPNRTCAKWLDCVSYVKDEKTGERTCYAVGECTRLDDNKECASFENISSSTIRFSNNGLNQNATGYYLLDKYHLSNMKEVGLNSDAHYDFEDSIPTLSCKRVDGGACSYKENIAVDFLQRDPKNPPASYPAHGTSYLKIPASYLISPQSENSWVTVLPNKKYFINFLVNTEKSGTGAKVKLTTRNNSGTEYSIEKNFYSNNGWTRQIFSFDPGAASKIRIELGATTVTSDAYVYFDDINIEPVLEVGQDINGNKQYISRECRLYPTNDSLTCVNKNNNVLKDGLEGYCLVHDANNKEVCLMWYPIDKISSTQLNRTSSGYKGKFPLNYCAEVNGNFDLVDYRKPYYADNACTKYDRESDYSYTVGYNSLADSKCASGYKAYVTHHNPRPEGKCPTYGNGGVERAVDYIWCVPDGTPLARFDNNKADDKTSIDIMFGNQEVEFSGSAGWYKYTGAELKFKLEDNPVRVLDYNYTPADENGLKYISGNDPDKLYRLTCNNFVQLVDNNGDNKAWAARVSENSIYATDTPPYFIDGNVSFGPGPSSVHNISAYGRNRQDTPFGAAIWPDDFNLLSSNGAVKLRSQYSTKNKEDVLAGRPYGCSNYKVGNPTYNEKGSGCSNIGYCSLDPNVFCLVYEKVKYECADALCTATFGVFGTKKKVSTPDTFAAKKTCAEGGLGTCVPLWSNYLGALDGGGTDYQTILKNLFINSYNSYTYSSTDEAYMPGKLSVTAVINGECSGERKYDSINNIKLANACYIKPTINNIVFNGKAMTNGANVAIDKKGIFKLSFTTKVDPEQQPLKQIHVKWGDGTEQIVTGQDSIEDINNPHIFYHYYTNIGAKQIEIIVKDNWDKESN